MAIKLEMLPIFLLSGAASIATQKYLEWPLYETFAQMMSVGTLIYLVYWSYIYPFYISPMRVIPTVPGFPLWGQFFTIIKYEVGVPNRTWHQKYGPIVRYFFPFGAERLSIADDDALTHMCIKNPYNYPKPDRAKQWMVRILGEGVLLAEGNPHKHQRKALAPGFSIQSIKALTPIFWRKALLLSKLWERDMLAEKASTLSIEVLEWLNRTTLDIIGEAGFGTDLDSLEHPETPIREAYRLVFAFDIMSRVLHGLAAFIPMTKYLPAKMNRDILQSRNIIISKATDIVRQKHKATHAKDKDIIALIVKDNMKMEAAGEAALSFETMRDQVMTFLGAGHDTTATGVAWTLHLLSTHPEIQARVRREIKQHYPFLFNPATRNDIDRLSRSDADHLPYLDNVCRESLRYIPPIPMTVRESIASDTLGGFPVPAKTTVYIHANAIHRLPTFWGDNADVFDPDRWDHLPEEHTSNAFMTFLQGPRGCIGRKFAETEMKSLVICLLSMYRFERDFETQDPEDWKMWRLVLRPRDGVTCKVTLLTEAEKEGIVVGDATTDGEATKKKEEEGVIA
ncbi:MAG: hypothetical protein Q9164_002656 [Protoblastenia rupestris]